MWSIFKTKYVKIVFFSIIQDFASTNVYALKCEVLWFFFPIQYLFVLVSRELMVAGKKGKRKKRGHTYSGRKMDPAGCTLRIDFWPYMYYVLYRFLGNYSRQKVKIIIIIFWLCGFLVWEAVDYLLGSERR